MLATRVIVVLTLIEEGLYRTRSFKDPSYVGDPLNAIRIFNDKEVDELLVLDITPNREPDPSRLELYSQMASQAFMPTSFGGGLTSMDQVESVFRLGYDKVVFNSSAVAQPELIGEAAKTFGTQSIVVSIDVAKKLLGKRQVVTDLGRRFTGLDPIDHAKSCADNGAGEIIIRSVRHDGLMQGYDLDLIAGIADAVDVPVVAAGGAGSISDFADAMEAGAQAVSAGSMFVYHGKHRAVLINYPGPDEFERDICVH